MFGSDQPIDLILLDIEPMLGNLGGLIMELQDCAFELLHSVVATADPEVAFRDVDVALLVGAMPRKEGMERADLLNKNAAIFTVQGEVLNRLAKRTVKVLVVGNPANTNCLLARLSAPDLPSTAFACLTFLDHNRLRYQVAAKVGCAFSQVHNTCIWGNHSKTQYPDISHAYIAMADGTRVPAARAINDDAWVQGAMVTTVQNRGGAVIAARKLSSAASAAKAISDCMRTWWHGTAPGEYASMGVLSDGSYGVPEGLIYSFPVTIADGVCSIVRELPISDYSRHMMDVSARELLEEREIALAFIKKAGSSL